MNWLCKTCDFTTSKRQELLKHYRLKHGHCGRSQSIPCLYSDCPCTFKTWSSLRSHLSRYHPQSNEPGKVLSFICQVCKSCSFNTEKQYFEHLGGHLKKYENVLCVFKNCDYSTNIYTTFASHKSRKHTPHSLEDFKTCIFQEYTSQTPEQSDVVEMEDNSESVFENEEDLSKAIIDRLGCLFLKLEGIYNVSNTCINEIVEELHFITTSASGPIIKEIISSTLRKHDCNIYDSVISEVVTNLCQSDPVSVALGVDGPFSTSYKRASFMKKHFSIVEPVEYILNNSEKKTFQYIPILPLLTQLLNKADIQEMIFQKRRHSDVSSEYKSFHDGSHFRENVFLSGEELKLSLILYVDDFEVCNPLGTSRKKHKITAVYWVLADIPATSRSTLTSIYLAILCKASDVKEYGYPKVLEPLLTDLKHLEDNGLFVPSLGKAVKGTVFCVVADNLGAHSIAGFVESFTSSHFCRFCIGERSQIQEQEVRTGIFPLRSKHEHSLHIEAALADTAQAHYLGVKRQCAITDRLSHFHVTSGYPPDVLHDLLEGIIPLELALCLNILIKRKYFSLEELNRGITQFPYKWNDKVNCPQAVPLNFASRKTIGGNAHENWLTMKDIVELVMAPIHTNETIGYLDSKIGEHRYRFLEVFPEERITPKLHFLEHYPWLITAFGPLVALWTMRFEGKHSFFKKIVRQTGSFRNILLTVAKKHQSLIAFNLHGSNILKPALTVSTMTKVAVEVLKENIKESVVRKYPGEVAVNMANKVTFLGTEYCVGMLLPLGSSGGLPDFAEILQIIIAQESPVFVVKRQSAWYHEHLRSFQVESMGSTEVIEHSQLTDFYPLVAYYVAGGRMVSLKHYICISE